MRSCRVFEEGEKPEDHWLRGIVWLTWQYMFIYRGSGIRRWELLLCVTSDVEGAQQCASNDIKIKQDIVSRQRRGYYERGPHHIVTGEAGPSPRWSGRRDELFNNHPHLQQRSVPLFCFSRVQERGRIGRSQDSSFFFLDEIPGVPRDSEASVITVW